MLIQLNDSVYLRKIYLFQGSYAELTQHLTEKWGKRATKGLEKNALGMSFNILVPSSSCPDLKTPVYYLWTVKFNDSPEDLGTLAHEAFHVATTILEYLGVDTSDSEGSEGVAYYMESIFVQCLTHLRKETL